MKNLFTFLFLLTALGITQAQTPILSPLDRATGVTATQEVSVTFDHAITAGTNFYNGVTFTPNDYRGNGYRIDNNKLIFDHANFTGGVECNIKIEANVIEGQTEPIEWSFTVKPLVATLFTPVNGATGVADGEVISVLFDMGIALHENKSFYSGGITVTPSLWDFDAYFNDSRNGIIMDYYHFAANTTYTVKIAGDVLAGQPNPIIWSFTTKSATDEAVYPANGTTASLDADTYVKYNMYIEEGANIKQVSITPTPGNYFSYIQNRALVIQHDDYQAGTTYTVTVPANAIKGIDQELKWSFTAQEVGLTSSSPEGGETGVAVNAEVKAVFANDISAGASIGDISFTPEVTGISGSVSGNTLAIAHNNFAKGTDYTVTIPVGAIAGVTAPIKWSFTTEAPKIISTSITRGQTNVAVAAAFNIEYDGNISAGSNFNDIKLSPDPGNVKASINGTKLTIAHDNFAGGTPYTVTIPPNAIKGQVEDADSWSFTTIAPIAGTKTPNDGATDVAVDAEVSANFSTNITAGSLSGIGFEPAVTGTEAVISGSKLTIKHDAFTAGTQYTVTIPKEAINGLAAPVSWKFTTVAPTDGTKKPTADAQNVDLKATVSVEFNVPIAAGTAIDNIKFTPDVSGVKGTVNGKTLTIAHADFAKGTPYTVTIPANAVKGQSSEISWKFTTEALSYKTKTPDAEAKYVAINNEVSVEFDTDISLGTEYSKISINSATGVSCTISGKKLTINHSAFAYGTDYTVTIPANALVGLTSDLSWKFTTIAPIVSSKTPAENTTIAASATAVSVVFAANIFQGTDFEKITIAPNPGDVKPTISGNTLSIGHQAFVPGREYTVTIPADAIKGLNAPVSWKFATIAPVVQSKTPEDGAPGVAVNTGMSIVFASDVEQGAAFNNISISPSVGLLTQSIDKNIVTIEHTTPFNKGTDYTVIVPIGAIKGQTSEIKWTFTSIAPKEVLLTPATGSTGIALNGTVSIDFEENINLATNPSAISFTPSVANPTSSVSGKKLTIGHGNFVGATTYTVTVPAGVIKGQVSPISWKFTTVAPTAGQKIPAEGAVNVATNAVVSVTFDSPITLEDNATVTITPNPGNVTPSVSGNTLNITHGAFTGGTIYTVTIPANTVKGIDTDISWKFTTVMPGIKSRTPDINSTDVALSSEVSIEFNSNITKGADFSKITINPDPGNVSKDTDGSKLVISHNAFALKTTYKVTIPVNAIVGLTSPIEWSFTTVDLKVTTKTPDNNTTGIAVDAPVYVEFNMRPTISSSSAITLSPSVSNMNIYQDVNKIAIAHGYFDAGTTYTITIPAGAVKDYASDIQWSFTTVVPVESSKSPKSDATDVAVDADVFISYDRDFVLDNPDGVSIEPDPGNVKINKESTSLRIGHDYFVPGTKYTVTIKPNTIRGISTTTSWSFTVVPLEIVKRTPEIGVTEVAVDTPITVEFNMNINQIDNNSGITLSPEVSNVSTYRDGKTLIISHGALAAKTTYTVTIPANTIKGYTDEIKWTFTTAMVSGIKDMDKLDAKLYPNPVLAGTEFTILTDDNGNAQRIVEIFNATGAVVLKTETSNSLIKLTAPKEQGVYLLRIISGNKAGVYRLVVY